MDTNSHLLTDGAAARFLRMRPTQLIKLAEAGGVPHVRLPDGELRFDKADLCEWVDAHKHQPEESAPA